MSLPMAMAIVLQAAQAGGFEDFFYMTMPYFYVLGMVLSVTFPLTVFLFWKRIMPPVLRTLFWATRRREPLLLLCHDSGRSILTTIGERQGEGIVKTAQGKYKILPRFAPKLPLSEIIKKSARELAEEARAEQLSKLNEPQAQLPDIEKEQETVNNTEGDEGEAEPTTQEIYEVLPVLDRAKAFTMKTLKEQFLFDFSDYVNKRSLLIGLDLPIFVGYTGKLCLLNPEALALYEAGDMVVKTTDMTLWNPNNYPDKDMNEAMQPLLLMNPRKIQEIIHDGFDQSQIAGVVADTEEYVRSQMGGGALSGKMKMIIIFLIMAGAGVAALFLLPQLAKMQQAGIALEVARYVLGV